MKFKKILLILLILIIFTTISTVNAIDTNTTTELNTANNTASFDKISNIDNTKNELSLIEDSENLSNTNENKLSDSLDNIKIELRGDDYYEYNSNGYTISTYISNIQYENNANYYLNLLIYNKNHNLVFNSTKEVKKSHVYADGTEFNVNIPGGSYTTILTLKMVQTLFSKQYTQTSKSFKYTIYLESKSEHDTYMYDDSESEKTEIVKIKAPKIKVKYKSKKYYFNVALKYKNGHPIKYKYVTLKIWTGKKFKKYKLTTNSKGVIKFSTKRLKLGTHKVKISYEDWNTVPGYYGVKYSKIIVKKDIVKKTKTHTSKSTTKKKKGSNWKSVTLKIKSPSSYYFACKKLKNGDKIETVYSLGGQYSKGVYAQIMDYDYPIHTKIKKVKFYFKKAGHVKTKTVKHIKNSKYSSIGKTSLISGYTPFKATVWYK